MLKLAHLIGAPPDDFDFPGMIHLHSYEEDEEGHCATIKWDDTDWWVKVKTPTQALFEQVMGNGLVNSLTVLRGHIFNTSFLPATDLPLPYLAGFYCDLSYDLDHHPPRPTITYKPKYQVY